jgi:hypothetical protein
MYRYFLSALLLAGVLSAVAPVAKAQSALLDLPRESQHAKISQKIGITEITIDYSRPLMKGRKVFGGLEPYGKVWRVGANENTTISFSDPVTVEGQPIPAGIYGLHMIPGESEWTVVFSKANSSWGSYSYDQKEDALRVTVKPQTSEPHEALTFDFDDPKPNGATIAMRWDKVAVPFQVEVNTDQMVAESLRKQLRGRVQYEWQGPGEAADYLLAHKLNLEDALKYADASIQNEERFENVMAKANILDALHRTDEATSARNKALAMANAVQLHSYGRQLQQQGKQEQAFDAFRTNIKKNPSHWLVHNELARLACAKGDFNTAVKEMKLSVAGADPSNKPMVEGLVTLLEKKEDINK